MQPFLWLLLMIFELSALAQSSPGTFLWPTPQSTQWGDEDVTLNESFYMTGPWHPVLLKAIDRYTKMIFDECWIPVQVSEKIDSGKISWNQLTKLDITVRDMDADLGLETNETYTLHIPNGGRATLDADTVWAALRGLETFSQIVLQQHWKSTADAILHEPYPSQSKYGDDCRLYIPNAPVHIFDQPRFSHRGLMLDTSRNFYPVQDILRTLEAMAFNKMNVFHWHITDSHSFPLELDNTPELAFYGAYRLQGKRLAYTKHDVRHIIGFAYDRGIRVIPEIDMPAHSASWANAFRNITTCTDQLFQDTNNDKAWLFGVEPGAGQLNPIMEETYTVVQRVWDEVTKMFPDALVHGGGDEPNMLCWEDKKNIRDYLSKYGKTGEDLLHTFLDRELNMIRKFGKSAILWEDSVTHLNIDIPKDTILQVWSGHAQRVVKKGYRAIASYADFWYLDCGHGGWIGNDTSYDEQIPPTIPGPLLLLLASYNMLGDFSPSNWGGRGGDWCSPFKNWQRIYSYDMTYNLTDEEASLVIGGEVALWSEQADETVLDSLLWPRAAAAAEVLWSGRQDQNKKQRSVAEALPRIFDWRFRLLARGIRAEPLQPLWCGQHPKLCDTSLT